MARQKGAYTCFRSGLPERFQWQRGMSSASPLIRLTQWRQENHTSLLRELRTKPTPQVNKRCNLIYLMVLAFTCTPWLLFQRKGWSVQSCGREERHGPLTEFTASWETSHCQIIAHLQNRTTPRCPTCLIWKKTIIVTGYTKTPRPY